MNVARSHIVALLALLVAALPAISLPVSPSERVRVFAECAGRYSAMSTFRSIADGKQPRIDMHRTQYFADLVAAILPDAIASGMPGKQALAWRIQAKSAQSVLLHQAHFSFDKRLSERSKTAVNQYLATCDGMMLGS